MASDAVGIGPAVLVQKRQVLSQLARIERLERSKSIRDSLRLLTFNSIIEACRLGTQADAILAIAKWIKEVSAEWNQITDQSGYAMEEMMNKVKHTNETMEIFSESGNGSSKRTQEGTRGCLTSLRTASAAASTEGSR